MQKAKRELGERLRRRRKAAGLLQSDLGRLLGISQGTVSKLEIGQARIDEDVVRAWIDQTSDARDADAETLLGLVADASGMVDWSTLHAVGWDQHQLRYDQLEREASRIRTFQNAMIPGLLQTGRYTNFLMREVVGLDADRAAAAVTARLARQDLLYRPSTRLDVVVTEAVLHHRMGGAAIMAEQLQHVAELATLPTVSFRVIPIDTEMPSRYGASFDIFEPASEDANATVVVELEASEYREDDPARVDRYRKRHGVYEAAALDSTASRSMVAELARTMRDEIFMP